jgi:ATP-binding cassette subfamily G (WHITE) protein 2 (SNQ2)
MLFLFTLAVGMKAWFRGLAAACKSPATAQTFAGISVLAMALYTGKESVYIMHSLCSYCAGYTIPQPTMIGALRWITYINVSSSRFEVTSFTWSPGAAAPPIWVSVCHRYRLKSLIPTYQGSRFY